MQPDSDVPQLDLHRQRPLLDAYEDFSSMRASDLKMRIEELLRIKVSGVDDQCDLLEITTFFPS